MNQQKLLQTLIGVGLILLLSVGCSALATPEEKYEKVDPSELSIDFQADIPGEVRWDADGNITSFGGGKVTRFAVGGKLIELVSGDLLLEKQGVFIVTKDYGKIKVTFNYDFSVSLWLKPSQKAQLSGLNKAIGEQPASNQETWVIPGSVALLTVVILLLVVLGVARRRRLKNNVLAVKAIKNPNQAEARAQEFEQVGRTVTHMGIAERKQVLLNPVIQAENVVFPVKIETLTPDEIEAKRRQQENSREFHRKKIFREQGRCETCGHKLGWIARLKGEVYCAKHIKPDEADVVNKTGKTTSDLLMQKNSADRMPETRCQKCGNTIHPGERFCRICGASLAAQTASVELSSSASGLLTPPNSVNWTPEIHCQKCGNLIRPGERFCRICGSALTEKTASVEPVGSIGESKSDQAKDVSPPPTQPRLLEVSQAQDIVATNKPQVLATAQEKALPGLQFEVRLPTGVTQVFDSARTLSETILQGTLSKSLKARTITINPDGKRTESKWATVEKIAISQAELRSLYRPIWDDTLKFLTYGAYVGFALKALDTTITLFAIDALVGIFWLAALGSLLAGKKWPAAPMAVIIASVVFGLRINLFVAVLSTMLVGYIFGAPFGMLIGTMVGLFRKGSRRTAPDAEPEGLRPYLLGLLLPLVLLAITIPLYIWLNAKMAEWLF